MQIQEIIDSLKKLDLATYPKDAILKLFNEIGVLAHVVVTLHKGKSVMRARPNNENIPFEKKSDYSYKPQVNNHTYQRASTPDQTMFYATLIPDKIEPGELDNMRVIGVAETMPMLHDNETSFIRKISFGKWVVQEDINLVAIVQKKQYSKQSSYTKELALAYNNFIMNTPKEISDRSLKYTSYLADEFSKEEISSDYDYMISAIFSQIMIKFFDGIIYPSVRVDGKGFNIAIKPEATKKLGLFVAGECTIYKHREKIIIDNDAIIELNGTEEVFKLNKIKSNQNEILERLGVNSIKDLV